MSRAGTRKIPHHDRVIRWIRRKGQNSSQVKNPCLAAAGLRFFRRATLRRPADFFRADLVLRRDAGRRLGALGRRLEGRRAMGAG